MLQIKYMGGISSVNVMTFRQEELVSQVIHESGILKGRKP